MENIILKGKKDRLVIQLNKESSFETLENTLKEKLKSAGKFFGEEEMAIEFTGRELESSEEDILLEVLKGSGIDVSCVVSENNIIKDSSYLKRNLVDSGATKFYRGSIRSGGSVSSNGNIVILGDVNPGAKVEAMGNIVVLGFLNGTAHAGGNNEERAFIAALKMNPIQLRIGSKIARSPHGDMLSTNRIKKEGSFEVAHIKDDEMIIEHLNRETLENMIKI